MYHTMDQVFGEVDRIVEDNSGFMKMTPLTLTDNDYSATVKVVTIEPGGLSDDHSGKLRLLVNFGEHGRELISSEVALMLMHYLAEPAMEVEKSVLRGHPRHRLATLLQQTVIKLIPMENVHGRAIVEAGSLCERKNGRGVDPNRNWDLHWGHKEKDYDPMEEYEGPKPFSEPEAMLMRQLAKDFQPHVWVNVHSGMEALFMPYDHVAKIPDGEAAQATLRILEQLNTINCGGRCAVGSGGKSVGYLAHGTATDYMYDKLGVPLSFTWEIYGDEKAPYTDCFRMFNPLQKKQVDDVAANWASAIFTLLELLPGHPAIPKLKVLHPARRGAAEALGSDAEEVYNLPGEKIAAKLTQKIEQSSTLTALMENRDTDFIGDALSSTAALSQLGAQYVWQHFGFLLCILAVVMVGLIVRSFYHHQALWVLKRLKVPRRSRVIPL
ncbi:hypothetical protein WJX72_004083 [[Myrmecia] bisecta]|uniref:Peptidase M14 domain-containing protein n=1 Tax=[Myrmecia] bisecta TaxID=41462 RepID=A0AAW1P5T5_9CHLO